MKNLISGFFAGVFIKTVAFGACGLYEHPNGTGTAFRLESNTAHNDFRSIMISRRSWHGHFHGWRGSDRNFNDEVTSVAVDAGCTLELYAAINYEQQVLSFPVGSFNLMGVFDNQASSAVCRCGGQVGNSVAIPDAASSSTVLQEIWGGSR